MVSSMSPGGGPLGSGTLRKVSDPELAPSILLINILNIMTLNCL